MLPFPLVLAAALAAEPVPLPASPLLPPDHWAVKAAERLHEVGLNPSWMPAQRAAPILAVARALESAVADAERDASPYLQVARSWLDRFHQEWPGVSTRDGAPDGQRRSGSLGVSPSVGFESGSTRNATRPSGAPGTVLLTAPGSNGFVSGTGAATWGDHFAAGATLHATAWMLEARSLEAVVAAGSVQLSVGRSPVGYGPNEIGGVVASGSAAIDRVELMTTSPFRLPWILGTLGDFTFDTVIARFPEARHPYTPLFWEFQLQWRPLPRLTLAAIRGFMFGGAIWDGIPPGQVPLALLALRNYLGNNVYSGSIQYRLPTEPLLPLTVKLDWGSDDEAAAAWKWPGLVAGISAPMLPGLPASLGVEYAYFGKGIGPPHDPFGWYAHSQYVGGWATGETPLGDPLGGNGRALRLVGSADALDARLRLAGAAWVEDRFADNLYAPAAAGRSVGGRAEVELRMRSSSFGVRGSYERGRDGWSRGDVAATMTAFF